LAAGVHDLRGRGRPPLCAHLPWAVGFLIGAIVAPPDVVAPLAIARSARLAAAASVVLEGEGLAMMRLH